MKKVGKEHEMPTHHNLDRTLRNTIAALAQERKEPLFRTIKGHCGELTGNFLLQSDVWRMICKRALPAGIETEIGCHIFRATGITAYLKNGGRLEIAQQMPAHDRPEPPAYMTAVTMKFRSMRGKFGIRVKSGHSPRTMQSSYRILIAQQSLWQAAPPSKPSKSTGRPCSKSSAGTDLRHLFVQAEAAAYGV
jgi:integrase